MTARVNIYTIAADGKSMTCHLCGFTHFSPQDIVERFCRHCSVYLDDVDKAADMARELGIFHDEPTDRVAFFRRLLGKLRLVGRPTHRR